MTNVEIARALWCRARPIGVAVIAATVIAAATGYRALPLRAQTQTFRTPTARVENVRYERAGGGIIRVQYDLMSEDANAVFTITLDVSQDSGQTFSMRPLKVTGDIGANVRPGANKVIVWDASAEVDTLLVERFRFRVTPERAALRPVASVGTLIVRTTPAGAAVQVDGRPRGLTPLTLSDVEAGKHRVLVVRDGFLENSSEVDVAAGATATVEKQLTAATPVAPKKVGGGGRSKLLIPLLAAGGAGGAFAIKAAGGSDGSGDGGSTPVAPSVDGVWQGSLASSSTVRFGGPPNCFYSEVVTNITVTVNVSNGLASSVQITGTATETAELPCSVPATGTSSWSYSYTGGGTFPPQFSGEYIITPSAQNVPPAVAFFWTNDLAPVNNSVLMRLQFVRSGQPSGSNLNWSIGSDTLTLIKR